MRKVSVVLVGVFLLFTGLQPAWSQKERFQSIFIYNFSKYVKWPDGTADGKFVIGVFGNSSIEKDLKTMAASKQVNGLPIEVRQFASTAGIDGCNILYVPSSESGKISEIVSSTQNRPVLIVTDKPGLAGKGAAINFVDDEGKIKFELNQQNAESRGLKISGSLASLAIIV